MKKFFTLLTALLAATQIFANIPSYFIPNKGQIADTKGNLHPEVKYKYQGQGMNLYFQEDKLVYHFLRFEDKKEIDYTEADLENKRLGNFAAIGKKVYFYRLDLHFEGASDNVQIEGSDKLSSYSNFYLPSTPEGLLQVEHFEKLTYRELYPGVDLVFYLQEGKLKYDLVAAPGADISKIRFRYEGAEGIELLESGELQIKTPIGTLIEGTPLTYEQNSHNQLYSSYTLNGSTLGFKVESDQKETIVIDPTVTWSTYYNNGSSSDTWTKPTFDNTGAFYNTGYTYYTTFPLINAGSGQYFDSTKDGSTDLVVVKFSPTYAYTWATYYGGSGNDYVAGYTDYGKALAVDGSNNVYFAGQTNGVTFPTYNPGGGAFYQDQTKIHGETAFIVKLNSAGVRLWATMFQHENVNTNSSSIRINGIAIGNNQLYFTGQTYRSNTNDIPLRTLTGAYNNSTWKGPQDVFIGRFTSTCVLQWSTYLNDGGLANASYRQGCDLNIDNSGNLWFVGRHSASAANAGHYLLNPGGGAYYQAVNNGDQDLIITKFNSSMVPVYSTYFGGNDQDIPSMINNNSVGDAVITLRAARSTNLPVYNPGGGAFYQATKAYISSFDSDAALLKLSTTGVRQWATYYGGSAGPSLFSGVGFDGSDNIYVFGSTQASNFPTQSETGSYNDALLSGTGDVVFLRFTNAGVRQWATFYGGSGTESLYSPKGEVSASGCSVKLLTMPYTNSTDFPTTNPGGGAFFESAALSTNANTIVLLEETSASGNSTAATSASASLATVCAGNSTTLSITGGTLGTGATWNWYSASCGGTLVGTGPSVSVSPASTTTYYVRAEGTCNTTTCVSVTVTVNSNSTAPASASASTPTLCSGSSTTLSVSGGSLGTGAAWNWYSGTCGGTLVGTGTSLSVSPASTTTYFVRAEGTCNTTTCASVTVTVNSSSTAPTSASASSPSICSGSSVTLTVTGGSLGTGAAWNWYSGSCGGTLVGTGSILAVSPASTTTYFVRAEGTCNTSTCASVTVSINSSSTAPTSAAASSPSICSGSSTTLSVSGGSLGTGAAWNWYSGTCGGTLVGTGTSLSVSPASTTTYFVRAEGTCNTTSCASVTVTVNSGSTAPTSAASSSPSICSGSSVTLTVSGGSLGTGAAWNWYSGTCGGTLVGTGSILAVSPASTTTYFVRAEGTCNTSTCASVTVTVDASSSAPVSATASSASVCNGSSSTLTVNGGSLGTGATWNWYSGSCGGTLVGTGASLSVSPASTTTYFVRAEGTCNTTSCASVTINVNTPSTDPTSAAASTSTICNGSSTTLSVSGGSLGSGATWNWYSGSCGGTPVGTGSILAVSPSVTTTYFVRGEGACNNTTCVSVTVTVNSTSAAPTAANATVNSVCAGGSTTLSVSGGSLGTGASWNWYEGSCNGTFVGTGASIPVSPTATTTYYVNASGTCNTTSCQSVTITFETPSTAPVSAAASTSTVCPGTGTTLSVSGGSLGTGATWNWYSGSCSGTLEGSGASLTVNPTVTTTYFVKAEGTCNSTSCASVTVNVNSNSTAPASAAASSSTICAGTSATLTLSGGSLGTGASFNWYAGSCNGTSAGTGTSITVSPTVTTTYYANASGTCNTTSCVSVTVNVDAVSVAPTSASASATSVCSGAGVTLTANGGTAGTGAQFTWYDNSCNGNIIGTGTSITVNPVAATTYFVNVAGTCNTTACEQVTVAIDQPNVAADSISASSQNLCSTSTISLTANGGALGSGAQWEWHEGSCTGPLAGTGTTITVTPTVATTYYVTAIGGCNTTSCVSTTISANPVPATWNAPSIICSSAPDLLLDTLLAAGTPTGGTWYGPGVTGNTFDPTGLTGSVTLSYVLGSGACQDSVAGTIAINVAPPSPAVSSSGDSICAGSPVILSASGSGTGATYSVFASATGGTTIGNTPLTVTPTATTTYYIESTSTQGCINEGGRIPVTIVASPLPAVNAGPDEVLCSGSSVMLTASGSTDYLWSTGDTTASITVNPIADTVYIVAVDANGCTGRDTVLVDVITDSDIAAANDDTLTNQGITVVTNVSLNDNGDPQTVTILAGPYNGSATVNSSGDISYTPDPSFSGTDSVRYSICNPSCATICTEARLLIRVQEEIDFSVPGGFSPNGDGINDVWKISGLSGYPENTLIIFNRWGDEVFSAAPYNNDWHGQSGNPRLRIIGDEVVDGTYFYFLTLKPGEKALNGTIELIRK